MSAHGTGDRGMNIKSMTKRLTFYNLKKGFLYLKRYGVRDFLVRLKERFADSEVDYDKWIRARVLGAETPKLKSPRKWAHKGVFSEADDRVCPGSDL